MNRRSALSVGVVGVACLIAACAQLTVAVPRARADILVTNFGSSTPSWSRPPAGSRS